MAKYFIDFEASQFKQEIISVGCINERGDEFQSLVQPSDKKITSFITSLTGITKDMIENANTADVVFADFWDWISEDDEAPCFICYGNCDKTFVQNTLKNVTNLKAKAALLLIEAGIKDFAPTIGKTFNLAKSIGLQQLHDFYFKKDLIQRHDALEDAGWLKDIFEVFEHTDKKEFLTTFDSYTKDAIVRQESSRQTYCVELDMEFESMAAAARYLKENYMKGNKNVVVKNITKKLGKAMRDGIQYCGLTWKPVEKKVEEK